MCVYVWTVWYPSLTCIEHENHDPAGKHRQEPDSVVLQVLEHRLVFWMSRTSIFLDSTFSAATHSTTATTFNWGLLQKIVRFQTFVVKKYLGFYNKRRYVLKQTIFFNRPQLNVVAVVE